VVFAEGEDERVLRTVQSLREEAGIIPVLVGRPEVISLRAEREGLSLLPGEHVEVVNPESDPRFHDYWTEYQRITRRQGVSPDLARTVMRTNTTAIAALMVGRGEADSLICGLLGEYHWHLRYLEQILGDERHRAIGALSLLILEQEPLFLADTQVHLEPTPEQIAETVLHTSRHIRRFGLEPKVALCAASMFGNQDGRAARTLREALALLHKGELDFEVEGEMTVEAALDPDLRERLFPEGALTGRANALVFANAETAGACRGLLKMVARGIEVGPILMGLGNRAHIVTPAVTSRGLLNVAALAGAAIGTGQGSA
jgi:malate dehydrogenase (oxaloacetate-decarboxylating)(NADP+)